MFNHIQHNYEKITRTTAKDGSRVYRTPSGKAYPSVTSVTGLLNKQAIIEWRKRVGEEVANQISTRAASRGTRVHSLCEDYLNNEELDIDIFDQEMWNSILPELNKINNIHALESQLYSDHLEVAGTVDCIAEYEGKLSVIDFKTSRRQKTADQIHNYFMQCSAYAVAFEERTQVPVNRLTIIMAVDDSEPLVFHESRDNWIFKFRELRNDYKKVKGV